MTALVLSLIEHLWPYLLAVGGAMALLWRAYAAGKKAEKAKQAEAEMEARDIRDQVDNDIGAMPADKALEELGKWKR
ncbi:MAG: ABC transporter permease [Hyphomicrobiales bacterium]|nr:ABC transporter permease [Hyphomicrobiales bacterium]